MRKFEDVDVNPEFEAFEAVAHSHGDDTIRWKFPRTSSKILLSFLMKKTGRLLQKFGFR